MDTQDIIDKPKITLSIDTVKKLFQENDIDVEYGFDRGLNFCDIKKKLIDNYKDLLLKLDILDIEDKFYLRRKKMIFNKIIYCLISLLQLRNGSRISEGVAAFKKFLTLNKFDNLILVKIAKSEGIKYKRSTKQKYLSKARYRKMIFPTDWIKINNLENINFYFKNIPEKKLQKRVLDYLLKYFNCNTHSLRYAFINHMIYVEKEEPYLVAKFVGHVNTSQLITYTQQKNCDKLFEKNI